LLETENMNMKEQKDYVFWMQKELGIYIEKIT